MENSKDHKDAAEPPLDCRVGLTDYPKPKWLEVRELEADNERLRAALTEARRWIGDGEFSDGLHHDYWTPEYRAAVALVDAALVPNAQSTPK